MLDAVRSVGTEIDTLFALREQIRFKEDEVKGLKKVYEDKAASLLLQLQAEGISGARGSTATAAIQEAVVPNVENWDEFYRWIRRNNAFHMLERRAAAAPFRELLAQRKKPLPGVVPYTRRTLSLRTL